MVPWLISRSILLRALELKTCDEDIREDCLSSSAMMLMAIPVTGIFRGFGNAFVARATVLCSKIYSTKIMHSCGKFKAFVTLVSVVLEDDCPSRVSSMRRTRSRLDQKKNGLMGCSFVVRGSASFVPSCGIHASVGRCERGGRLPSLEGI